jgi:fumarate hydratase subunit beta
MRSGNGMKVLEPPLSEADIGGLNAGDRVLITGTIYGARDAAHKRLAAMIESGETLPFDLQGAIVYYVGPCPAKGGRPTASAGPTTASRMDAYAPLLMKHGLKAMIGKGVRSETVVEAMREHKAVYFGAIGGAGALLAARIRRCEPIAFHDLGPEALYVMEVEEFPAFVVNDVRGNDLYRTAVRRYGRR